MKRRETCSASCLNKFRTLLPHLKICRDHFFGCSHAEHLATHFSDLRENGGGNDSVGYHILSTLKDKPTPGELSRSTRWIATYRAWGNAETPYVFLSTP